MRLFPILLLTLAHPALAQVDGKIIGNVAGRDTGRPLAGAVVTITGTGLGNVSDEDGTYFLNHVPVGVQTVAVSLLGYGSQTRRLRVLAGHTSTADFALVRVPIQAEEVVAVVEREPLLIRDKTASRTHFTTRDATGLPLESLDEVVSLSAGVYEGQGGFIVRGGRGSESATYVDGVLVSEFTTQRDLTGISTFAVEEVDVVTGGFGAEFGYAQSGLVNVVTRAGGDDFHGHIRFTTDGHFSTDGLDAEELGRIESEPCCGYNSLQVALGGPLVPGRLSLFGSLEATGAADIDPRGAGFNPTVGRFNSDGSTGGILPGNRGDRTRLHLKATTSLRGGSLSGTLLYSRDQEETYDPAFGVDQLLSGSALRSRTWDGILSWDRSLFRTADRELNLRVLAHVHRSEAHTGVPRSPQTAAFLKTVFGDACGAECDVQEDTFEGDVLNYRLGDVEFFFEDSLPGSVPTLRFAHPTGPDPIFGVQGVFVGDGIHHAFSHRTEHRATLRVDLDSQLNRFQRLKFGTEWTWIDLARRSGWLHLDSFNDIYQVDPLVGAVYVQHRWDAGDLVFDLGLRWDHWDPRTTFPAVPGRVACEIAVIVSRCTPGAPTAPGRKRDALAPRLGIAHPLTDRTQLRLSFGRFYQLPELQHYFLRHNVASQTRSLIVGNPQLSYVRTTALEVGLTHLISEATALDLVAYSRDRRGAIRTQWLQPQELHPDQLEMHVFVNGDHGNVKGLDLTLSRRFQPYLSADLTWSLQWARGTTSSPLEWIQTFGFLVDPLDPGRLLPPPNDLQPDSYDRLHAFDARLLLQIPHGFHRSTLAGKVLEDVGAALVYGARSGTPYTRVDPVSGLAIGDLGSYRSPWTQEGDLRLVKGLRFGSDVGLDLFVLVFNLFGEKNVLRVHSTTGAVDRDGSEVEIARDAVIPRSLLTEGAAGAFPVPLDDVLPEYRELVARQDLDRDGFISQGEAQESLRRAVIAVGGDSPYSYGGPRLVRFGVELRF